MIQNKYQAWMKALHMRGLTVQVYLKRMEEELGWAQSKQEGYADTNCDNTVECL